MKIKWKKSEDGYTQSHDGRWRIAPLFCGSTRAQFYELWDGKAKKKRGGWDSTQRQCKETAQRIVDSEA